MNIVDVPLEKRNLRSVLEGALAGNPDTLALRAPSVDLTYAQVWDKSLRFAEGLAALGVGRYDRVLFMLDNHWENALAWIGVTLAGMIEVPVNNAYKGEMLAHIVNDSGASIILIEEQYLERLAAVAQGIPSLKSVVVRGDPDAIPLPHNLHRMGFSELAATPVTAMPADVDPWDLVSISYTSGTTGRAKGVLCPQAHAYGHATTHGLGYTAPGETRFVVLPQFHIAGRWGGVYNALAHHAAAFVAPAFHASTFWDEAKSANAKSTQIVGTMAEFLWRQPARSNDNNHGLRETAVLPLPKNLAEWKKRFGLRVSTCYGSTETGALLSTSDATSASVGQVIPGYEVRIVDEHDIEVPAGTAGELVVRPVLPWTTAIGYHNQPHKTAEIWRNGWMHSGDALRRDEAGDFFFVDRVDDALRRRGENISSSEVEYLINSHPHVEESVIIGIPSEYSEDELMAVIILKSRGSITELELVKDLSAMMPYFMVPRFIQFVDDLPRTPTAKVKRNLLRTAGAADAWDSETAGFKATRNS